MDQSDISKKMDRSDIGKKMEQWEERMAERKGVDPPKKEQDKVPLARVYMTEDNVLYIALSNRAMKSIKRGTPVNLDLSGENRNMRISIISQEMMEKIQEAAISMIGKVKPPMADGK